jgi:Ca2+-binding EF-hand superfamily protein
MKDKLGEFESKISQMEMEHGSGSGSSVSGSVDVIVNKIESVQKEQVQSAEEQANKMGEVSLQLEQMSDRSSLVMQELEDLKRSSRESETLARESSELSRSLKRDLDSIDLNHMRSQVELAVERTNASPQGLGEGSYNDDSRRGAKDEEEDSQIPAIEQEINAIKGALEGTRESMKMLGEELSNVTESIHSIKQTNKFSLFLHDFYSSLHTHMAKNNYTIQEVFSSFDGDKDGFLSGNELLQLLELLVPGSSENDRKSLVFFVDPTNEDHIKYSRVLQNASNTNKSSGVHTVKFHINYYTQPNQHLRIVGAHESLGWWRVLDAPCMYEVEHGVWETKLTLPGATLYEYKYVVCDNQEALDWLPGSNLVLDLPPGPLQKSNGPDEGSTMRDIYVEDKWNSHPPTESLDSTVNARSTIMRMLSAAGGIPEDRLR